jgi:acyl carrier protein
MTDNSTVALDTEELRSLVADALELPAEEVTEQASFKGELEVESLMALEIVVGLEKRYGIKISESDFQDVDNLVQVRELVESKLNPELN